MKVKDKALIIYSPAFVASETESTWLPWLQVFVRTLNRSYPQLKIFVFAFQYPAEKKYQWFGNCIFAYNGMHKNRMARLIMWLRIAAQTGKTKKQFAVIGILSLWCTECTFVAKIISILLRLPYFCWIMGQDARRSNTYVKRIRPKASSLIAISDFLADEFNRSHGIKPAYLIPIGIDASVKRVTIEKDIDIIGAGSLSWLKQYDVFVQIIAMLRNEVPAVNVILCGDGEAGEEIKILVQKLLLTETITMKGFLQHEEVLQLMQRSKILLHTSSYEGFGLVCLEALHAGAHVISFIQPMHHNIKNWHVVQTKEEMMKKALALLNDTNTNYESITEYTMDETANAILKLSGYNFSG